MKFEDLLKIKYDNRPVYKSESVDELKKESEIFRFYKESRNSLKKDPYRPAYHYTRPFEKYILNDPNGLCFYKGKWHLFYQAINNPEGQCAIHWGHIVSDDMVHWVDLPDAHYPNPPETQCWSGGVCIKDGKVYSAHYGYNNEWNYGIVCSVSDDTLLLNWTRLSGNVPSIPAERDTENPDYRVYDPFIFEEDGTFYILSGRYDMVDHDRYRRQIYIFKSENGINWDYMHPFIVKDYDGNVSDDAGCPYFFKINGDKYLLLHFCHHLLSPKYAIGTYNRKNKTFKITSGGRLSQTGALHAPAVWPVGESEFCTIFNSNGIKYTLMSLPRIMNEHDGELYEKPYEELESLRYDGREIENLTVLKGDEITLENMEGREFELVVEYEKNSESMPEIRIFCSDDGKEYTSVYLIPDSGCWNLERDMKTNRGRSSVLTGEVLHSSVECMSKIPVDSADLLVADGETVQLRIFADRSVTEAFVNNKRSITLHCAPNIESKKIKIVAHGGDITLNKIKFWKMKIIF